MIIKMKKYHSYYYHHYDCPLNHNYYLNINCVMRKSKQMFKGLLVLSSHDGENSSGSLSSRRVSIRVTIS